jgi:hypothetical protein
MSAAPRIAFLIGPPRSGSTLLARMLGAHSAIHAPAEPHLLTPLAHLGYYARVESADYDPIIAETGIRELVASLPHGEADYLAALRAYSDALYGGLLERSGRPLLLDKTPAYALVLDFIARLYPDARYIVLTRHPLAVWGSYVESFFDGDHQAAHRHNPLLERYVPAIARFLRDARVPWHRVRYEDLVQDPAAQLERVCGFLDIPYEPAMIEYGEQAETPVATTRGLGDPVTVGRETRPTTRSLARWSRDLAGSPERIEQAQRILAALSDEDLETWGHARNAIEAELSAIDAAGSRPARRPLSRHALERRLLVLLRRNIHQNAFGRLVRQVRRVCDVLLR